MTDKLVFNTWESNGDNGTYYKIQEIATNTTIHAFDIYHNGRLYGTYHTQTIEEYNRCKEDLATEGAYAWMFWEFDINPEFEE